MLEQKQGFTLVAIIPYAQVQEFCAVWCKTTISFDPIDDQYLRCWVPNEWVDSAYYDATGCLRPKQRAVELFPIN